MPLTNARIKPAEFLRNIYAVTPEAGTALEALLEETYWCHVAKTLHISDRIEVIPEDGKFYAELFVLSVTQNRVKVKVLQFHDLGLEESVTAQDNDYEVVYRGQNSKHTVRRKKDKHTIKEGFNTHLEAVQWMHAYEAGGVA